MKKKTLTIIIVLLIVLLPFYLPFISFINIVSYYFLFVMNKVVDGEDIGVYSFNIEKKKLCIRNCYSICRSPSLDSGCEVVLADNIGFLEKTYLHDGILYVLTLKRYYSIKDKWNIDNNEYINEFKLINTEDIDGNIIEKYELVIEDKKYNIDVVYR